MKSRGAVTSRRFVNTEQTYQTFLRSARTPIQCTTCFSFPSPVNKHISQTLLVSIDKQLTRFLIQLVLVFVKIAGPPLQCFLFGNVCCSQKVAVNNIAKILDAGAVSVHAAGLTRPAFLHEIYYSEKQTRKPSYH